MKLIMVAGCALALVLPVTALAYCTEPSFPIYTPRAPQKPSEPMCVTMQNCTQFDIDMYRQELDSWVEDLRRYVQKAQDVADEYAADALQFAKCELGQ